MRRIGAQTLRGCCNRWIQRNGKRYRCGRTSYGTSWGPANPTGYCLDHLTNIRKGIT